MPDVFDTLTSTRVVPVVVMEDVTSAVPLARALSAGGLPVAEVTFRTAAAADSIRAIADGVPAAGPGSILVGAGTVLTPAQVDEAVMAGARFVVSPGLSRAVVDRCREHGVPVIAGAVTATEVQACLELGLDLLKFFPSATSGGVAAITALAGPFPGVQFVPTGGVGPHNVTDYLSLRCVPAVGGSWMVPPDLIESRSVDRLQRLASEAVQLAASVPKET
ncbi:bifunctional 4-hydroxy-2-oxoglutarate aldolase/2-dehydro-3-deoxy-phosphogluconate aldolase [Aeromicrobium sp. CTD01-1L150]|uniref:bifunctional 4-hydroxy-2-oxoglutarate aldolase/2-dehydro-3-deoxy-phosphogluconate aldolase n=1 Tax=Aeromicrobium sp. CTD01-1L150 TaxID=3341830 RepID=UPI0035C1029D